MQSRPAESVNFDSLTVPPVSRPEGLEYVQGSAILHESKKAYAALHSYYGKIKLSATGAFPGTTFEEQRTINVAFEHPGKLSLDGHDSNNDDFVILIDSTNATIEWHNKIQRYANGQKALHAFSGITLYGSFVLPGCLLDVEWDNEDYILPMDKSFLDAWATKARLNGVETIDDSKCHRVVCERDTVTWTIYIDFTTKLIRRADCEITEANMEQLKLKGARGGYTGNLMAIKRSQSFLIDKIAWGDRLVEEATPENEHRNDDTE